MIHHANARTVIVLDEAERVEAAAALSDVVRMIDEITDGIEDTSSQMYADLMRHYRALWSLLEAVSA